MNPFKKKNLKNPVSIIRTPEKINKEYTDLVFKLGKLQCEHFDIEASQLKMVERLEAIHGEREQTKTRIAELSDEMNEAQKELAQNTPPQAQAQTPEPTAPTMQPESAPEVQP